MRLALLASGTGSNAENIIRYFKDHPSIMVSCVITNKTDAPVVNRAQGLGVTAYALDNEIFKNGTALLRFLRKNHIDFIVLAGFLRLIPAEVIAAFRKRIINIHPALLPAFGGKGMFGMHVHKAVKKSGVDKTGITIHYVNEQFDAGEIIFQESIDVNPEDSAEQIQQKVKELELKFYPPVIEKVCSEKSGMLRS